MTAMSEKLNARTCEHLGKTKLEHFKKLIEGSKASISVGIGQDPCTADEALRTCAVSIDRNAVIISDANNSLLQAMHALVCKNMGTFTNAATLSNKRAVLESEGMQFIAVCSKADLSDDGKLYGFIAYKLDQIEDEVSTDYLYEIQVDESVQGKGLGSKLVSQLSPPNAEPTAGDTFLERC